MRRTRLTHKDELESTHPQQFLSRARVELGSRRIVQRCLFRRVGCQVFASGALGMMRWLEMPPIPSAVQAQEPKMRVVPSRTVLASLDSAIEFAEKLAETPTWPANCRCLVAKPAQRYP